MLAQTRLASFSDLEEIARIYNEGIRERIATFETKQRTPADLEKWIGNAFPAVVRSVDNIVVAFAVAFPYSNRECYSGIAEFSVYVDGRYRKQGHGASVMLALMAEAEKAGIWKLLSRVFVENSASRKMLRSLGFREVGIYEKHGKLDGV